MVTGITGANMTANVIGASVPAPLKDANVANGATAAPVKSDRRSNKPIMEKRRRARINNCLNELKTLILDATKKDPARHSKLEKADILEKTVKHLQELQRQQAAMQQAADPKVLNKFKSGFADCASEVNRFPGLDQAVKRRLLQHLSNCIASMKTEVHQHQRQVMSASTPASHVAAAAQLLPSPPSSPEQADHHLHQQQQQQQQQHQQIIGNHHNVGYTQIQHTVQGYFLPNGLQVIPTKLSNGSIALVLPQSLPQQQQQQLKQPQQHLLTPPPQQHMSTPTRTASTSSASSHSSSSGYETHNSIHYAPPSPANSYEAMDCKPSVIQHASVYAQQLQHQHQQQLQQQLQLQNQQPLSLVIKKHIKEEDQPWRPW